MSTLLPNERRMLDLLIDHLPRVKPGDSKTYLGYAQVHRMLGLSMEAPTWGPSLQVQGLENIARWAIAADAPAITGLVVDKDKHGWPAEGFFHVHARNDEDFTFWIDQTHAAKRFDWVSLLAFAATAVTRSPSPTGRGEDWLVEITWSEGVVELLDLIAVTEGGTWITTEENWRDPALPEVSVQYRAFARQQVDGGRINYNLEYRKQEQPNPLALKHGRSGRSLIVLDELGQGRASWEDDADPAFTGPAQRVRIMERPAAAQADDEVKVVNELSLTRFLATLRCRLRIGWYWSAAAENTSRVIFTVWSDQIHDNKYVLLPREDVYWKRLPGAYELRRHFPLAQTPGVEVYGVLCYPVDDAAVTRKRKYYNEHELVRLRIEQVDDAWVAHVGELVDVAELRAGKVVPRVGDAYDDLESPPGVASPTRVRTGPGSRYLRDAMIRQFVLQHAKGHCEFCGEPGFVMDNGRAYLECHHVEGLADGGPDTIDNVIALCPTDHRRAHYGRDRLEASASMLLKIAERNKLLNQRD